MNNGADARKGPLDDRASLEETSRKSIHWDEANLEENEKIKAELAPTKINEPKTPFHAPYSEDEDLDIAPDPEEEEEADMAPLSLEDHGHHSSTGSVKGATIRKASELTDSTIAEASQRLEHSHRRVDMEPSWSRSSGGYSSGDRGYTSSDGEALSSAARTQKRRRFEQRRRQHYDMKSALTQGRQLAQQELEDDYNDKDRSHEQRNVVSTNRVGSLRQQARQKADQQSQRHEKGSTGIGMPLDSR